MNEISTNNIVYTVCAYYLAGITIFGISVNSIVIYVVFTDSKLFTPINAVLLNLAFADSGIAFLGNPIAFYNTLFGDWMFGHKICVVYGFCMSLFGICSIYTLSLLAYQRYNIICRPFANKSTFTWLEAKLYIFGTWLCSFFVSLPPLFGWGSYKNEAANIRYGYGGLSNFLRLLNKKKRVYTSITCIDYHLSREKSERSESSSMSQNCSINWESREPNTTSYIMFLFLVALGIPILIIAYSYFHILRAVHKANHNMSFRNSVRSSVRKVETHVARMIFVMVIAFFVAWGPYAVFSLLIAFTNIELEVTTTVAPSLFAKSSVCYNPIIYFFLNSQFRKSLLRRMGIGQDHNENSNDVRQIPLSHLGRTGKSNIFQGANFVALVGMTNTSRLSSDQDDTYDIDSLGNTRITTCSDYKKRDKKISQLIPYTTLPFVRRKAAVKTRSVTNLSVV